MVLLSSQVVMFTATSCLILFVGIWAFVAISAMARTLKDAAQHGNSLRGLLAPRQMSLVTQAAL